MVALGSFFAAALVVAAFVFVCHFLNGHDQRRTQKILMLNRRKAIRQACRKSLESLAHREEIEIVPSRHRSGADLNWQHAMSSSSRQVRSSLSHHR